MGILAVTFRGPFAICIGIQSVDIVAPRCDGHRAAVSSVKDEHTICGRHKMGGNYVYSLQSSGIYSNCGTIPIVDDQSQILDVPQGSTADPAEASFTINAPRPNTIYAIKPGRTEVVKGNPTGVLDQYATGFRFFYDCDLAKPVSVLTPDQRPLGLSFSGLPSLPQYADIDFTYAGPETDDSEHADAIACFDKTMKLFGLPWWLNYGQSGATMKIATRTGADCKSVVALAGRGM